MDLNHARLPIPPPGRCCFTCYVFAFALRFLFSSRGTRLCILFEVCKSSGVFNYFLSGPVEGASCGMGMWYLGGRWAGPSARGHLAWFLASRRQFVELYINAMASSPARLLQQFIEDESSALGRGERGAFYPDNHHLITPLIVRAPRLLSEEDRVELYFHLLRGMCARRSRRKASSNCSARPMRVLLLQSEGYPVCTLPRARGLFLWPG